MEADEISREQTYFDRAADQRERMRAVTDAAPQAAAHPGAATRLRKSADAQLASLGGPDDAVAVGRFDNAADEHVYVGLHGIFDEAGDPLVVNWQAPYAAPYFEATAVEPLGLIRKRQFNTDCNRILDFEDIVFADLAEDLASLGGAPVVEDAILRGLDERRTGELHEVVQTIQATQYELVRMPLDRVLVVQGGPGTGKTIVALHRVSWLLYNHRNELSAADVLVLGPSRPFIRYIRAVLPSLGDDNVTQVEVSSLGPNVRRGREETAEVARLKGDVRMADLLRQALNDRIRIPDGESLDQRIGARTFRPDRESLEADIARLRNLPYSVGRTQLRSILTRQASEELKVAEDDTRQSIEQLLDRIWPQHTPQSFLQELWASRDRLLWAAGDAFTAREVALLQRTASRGVRDEIWSDADMALLDELNVLVATERTPQYRLIVVDEAQDLSPMQLRAIVRRSDGGAMTLLGDIAQSTGPFARDSWDDLLDGLTTDLPHVVEELRYGYRVPKEVFDVAARLLPVAAPGIEAPEIVRSVGVGPEFTRVDVNELGVTAVGDAMEYSSRGLSVGIICPDSQRAALERALEANGVSWRDAGKEALSSSINVVRPSDAKGLEFDAAVVVEPVDIVDEDERGHRLLYVALTRPTKRLSIVHSTADAIPLASAAAPTALAVRAVRESDARVEVATEPAESVPAPGGDSDGRPSRRIVRVVARQLADDITSTIDAGQWDAVVAELRDELDRRRT